MVTSPEKKSVLIIDDDSRVRDVLTMALVRDGFHTEGVESGGEGFRLYLEGNYDALMIDEALLAVNGLWLIRLLRLLDQKTTMVMISGVADLPTAVSGLRAGADDYISKPFKVWDLKDRLTTSINRRRIVAQKQAKGKDEQEGESSRFRYLEDLELPVETRAYLSALMPAIEQRVLQWPGFSRAVGETAEEAAERLSVRESDIRLLGQTAELQTIGFGGMDPAQLAQAFAGSLEWRDTWRSVALQGGELLESVGTGAARCGGLLRSAAEQATSGFRRNGGTKTLEQILWLANFCTAAEKWLSGRPDQPAGSLNGVLGDLERFAGVKVDPSISTAFLTSPG